MKCVGLIILFLHWSLSDAQRFELTGPDDVVAPLGSNIILPCSLIPRESAEDMEVTWIRTDLNDRVVHHYKDQQDKTSEQDPFYTDRTSLFKEKLKDGIASLLLKDVQLSDEGTYRCEVQDKAAYDSLKVKVIITGLAVVAAPGSDIILPCSFDPSKSGVDMEVTWIRPDLNNTVVHHYKDQRDKTSEQDPSYTDRTSLFKEKLKDGNTSLLLKDVQRSDMGKYACEVQGKGTYKTNKVTVTVTDTGKYPVITVLGRDESGGIQLLCDIKGLKFDPELQWVDSGGRELTAGVPERNKDSEGYNERLLLTLFGNITYVICHVKDHPSMKAEMDVSDIGFNPVISKLGPADSGGTRLQCETNGWKSKPDLEWFSDKGTRLINEVQNYTVVNGLYTVRNNITAQGSGNSTIFCKVKRFPSMNDRSVISDSSLLNNGQFSNPWSISAIILFILLCGAFVLIVILYFKFRGLTTKEPQREPDGVALQQNN